MSERLPGSWQEGASAAVIHPYINWGGVGEIAQMENEYLNTPGIVGGHFASKLMYPKATFTASGWDRPDSRSLGVAVKWMSGHEEHGTEANGAILSPFEIPELLKVSTVKLLSIHQGTTSLPAMMLGLLRKAQMNPDLVTVAAEHADRTEESLREYANRFRLFFEIIKKNHLVDLFLLNTPQSKAKYDNVTHYDSEVIENPIKTEDYAPNGEKLERFGDVNFMDGKFNIVSIFRVERRKGWRTALEVIAKSRGNPKFDNVRFIFAGTGPEEELMRQRAKDMGLGDRLVMVGFISEEDKKKLLETADLCYFPSEFNESFGNTLLQAWAKGKRAIGGMAYSDFLIKNGKNGYLLKTADPDEAIDVISRFLPCGDEDADLELERERRKMEQFALGFVQYFDVKKIMGRKMELARRVHFEKREAHRKQKTIHTA